MSVKVNEKIIEDMASLSKLNLSENEIEDIKGEITKIINYVDKLKELDTEDVQPMYQVFDNNNVFREDIIINKDDRENVLSNAPEVSDNAFVVPKTFD